MCSSSRKAVWSTAERLRQQYQRPSKEPDEVSQHVTDAVRFLLLSRRYRWCHFLTDWVFSVVWFDSNTAYKLSSYCEFSYVSRFSDSQAAAGAVVFFFLLLILRVRKSGAVPIAKEQSCCSITYIVVMDRQGREGETNVHLLCYIQLCI